MNESAELEDPRPHDWMHAIELQLMKYMSCSLRDIDETDTGSLFGFLGYVVRVNAPKKANILKIGSKQYKRVSADAAAWL